MQQYDSTTSFSTLARKPSVRDLETMRYQQPIETSQASQDRVEARPPPLRTSETESSNGPVRPPCGHQNERRSMEGTPLFTITEQNSISTLKTMPSNWTFQHRILTWQPHVTVDFRPRTDGSIIPQRRRCISLDEGALHQVDRHTSETSQVTSTGFTSSAVQSDDQSPRRRPPKPAVPPFKPPERVKTPEGVPSWPGNQSSHFQARTAHQTQGSLFNDLRNRRLSITRLRDVLRQHATAWMQVEGPRRPAWRPPASGHGTIGVGNLQRHPFANAPIAQVVASPREPQHSRSAQQQVSSQPSVVLPQPLPTASTPQVVHSVRSVPHGGLRTISPSERALQAASGSAIPVPLKRASTSIAASQSARRAPFPRNQQVRSPTNSGSDERSQSAPDGGDTTRTAELIDAFPAPPPHGGDQHQTRNGRPSVYSLFPRSNGSEPRSPGLRSLLFGADSGSAAGSVSARKLHKRASICSFSRSRGRTKTTADRAQSESQNTIGPLAATSADGSHEASSETERIGPNSEGLAVRGEASMRYRHSGTPVYELDVASLRSLDEQLDQRSAAGFDSNDAVEASGALMHDGPSRAVSSQTGTSRYFSAASEVHTRAEAATSPPSSAVIARHPDETEARRAVANGAHRFVRPKPLAERLSAAGAARPTESQHNENTFPCRPITVITVGRLCPHIADTYLRDTNSHETVPTYQLDGSTPNPARPPGHPGIHRLHAKGTWRTRMQRTKCWRCELHRRKEKGLARLRVCLGWTCFCRFKNYEESSSEEELEREEREMANLAPMMGSLG